MSACYLSERCIPVSKVSPAAPRLPTWRPDGRGCACTGSSSSGGAGSSPLTVSFQLPETCSSYCRTQAYVSVKAAKGQSRVNKIACQIDKLQVASKGCGRGTNLPSPTFWAVNIPPIFEANLTTMYRTNFPLPTTPSKVDKEAIGIWRFQLCLIYMYQQEKCCKYICL